jgi:hypothetical protein
MNLKNSESANRVFVVATGSSLENQDLTRLQDKIVIGMNSLFLHKDFKKIAPKYYVLTQYFFHVNRTSTEEELVKILRDMDSALDQEVIIFASIDDKIYFEKHTLFANRKINFYHSMTWDYKPIASIELEKFFAPCFTVGESSVQIALYLGFKEIILLGYDHDWLSKKDTLYFDTKKVCTYFKDSGKTMMINNGWTNYNLMDALMRAFLKYKALYAMQQNIYNATPESFIDVFPRVDYDTLFLEKAKNDFDAWQEAMAHSKQRIQSTTYNPNNARLFHAMQAKLFDAIAKLDVEKEKYLIYGYGYMGKTIAALLGHKIVGFVDKNTSKISQPKVYGIDALGSLEYDKVIISLLDREEEVVEELCNNYGVNSKKILRLADQVT